MSQSLASLVVLIIHSVVAVAAIRFVWKDRILTFRRFYMDVMSGRHLILVEIEVDDPSLGYFRSMIDGVTDHSDFTFLRVYDRRNGRCEYNLRINDLYYGAWWVKENGSSRLDRLYRQLRAS